MGNHETIRGKKASGARETISGEGVEDRDKRDKAKGHLTCYGKVWLGSEFAWASVAPSSRAWGSLEGSAR